MNIPIWIVIKEGADRPYCSTTPPTREHLAALKEQGCEVYRVDVQIPYWRTEDYQLGKRIAKAETSIEE